MDGKTDHMNGPKLNSASKMDISNVWASVAGDSSKKAEVTVTSLKGVPAAAATSFAGMPASSRVKQTSFSVAESGMEKMDVAQAKSTDEFSNLPPSDVATSSDDVGHSRECTICMDAAVDTVFIPCGHMATCSTCARRLGKRLCPVCREKIEHVQHVFFA